MIHSASSFSKQPKLLKLHFTSLHSRMYINKRSRINQEKIFKNTFKNRKLSTILTILRSAMKLYQVQTFWQNKLFETWTHIKQKTDRFKAQKGIKLWPRHQIWCQGINFMPSMLQNRLSVHFRALRGHEISCTCHFMPRK